MDAAKSDLELVKLPEAARLTGNIRTRDLRRLMAQHGQFLIAISPRRHFIRRADLELLQAALSKHPTEKP